MAPQQHIPDVPPPYSCHPTIDERVLAIAPDFSLAVDAIQLAQERFPGTSTGDAWEFIQQLTRLVQADVRNRQGGGTSTGHHVTSERAAESNPSGSIPEDSPMPDAA